MQFINFEISKEIFHEEFDKIFTNQPYTKMFHVGDAFDKKYYTRNMIECVNRINLNNELDSFAIQKCINKDNILAKEFTYYLYDEMCHDDLFLHDLKELGSNKEDVLSTPLFFSTELLMGYLNFKVMQNGALPAVVWDWVLEYYGKMYNGLITNKALLHLGKDRTKGAKSHLNTDEVEDHPALMFRIVSRAIKSENDAKLCEEVIRNSIFLIGKYFEELAQSVGLKA